MTLGFAGGASVWIALFNEEQKSMLLLGASLEKAMFWQGKKNTHTKIYFEHGSFELSMRHPSRDMARSMIAGSWSWVHRKGPQNYILRSLAYR